jgi:hypothetical protein
MKSTLPDFEGHEVRRSALRITKAGDGLSDALKLEVFFVLKGVVTQVNHKPDGKVEDGEVDELVRLHTVDATEVALVDALEVSDLLVRNRERVDELKRKQEAEEQRQREAEAGLMGLPGMETAEQLDAAHADGAHADGLVDGCPSCDAERDAAAAESSDGKPKGRKAAAK